MADSHLHAVLLRESTWLRRLARSLAHDEADADELTQETLRRALVHRPDFGPRGARPWLATVIRNLARRDRRRTARLRELEDQAQAADSTADAVAATVERADLHRHLVTLLLQLERRQREVLLLRYVDGLSEREIARRLGVPRETVRSRRRRGLQELRLRLDDDLGSRTAWLAPLLAMPVPSRFGSPSAVMACSNKTVLALAFTLALVPAWLLLGETESTPPVPGADVAAKPTVAAAPSVRPTPGTRRAAVPSAVAPAAIATDAEAPETRQPRRSDTRAQVVPTTRVGCPADLRDDFQLACKMLGRTGRELDRSVRLPDEVWTTLRPVLTEGSAQLEAVDEGRMRALGRVLDQRTARQDGHSFPNPRTVLDPAERRRIQTRIMELKRDVGPYETAISGGDATHAWVYIIHADEDADLRVAYQDIDRIAGELSARIAAILRPYVDL